MFFQIANFSAKLYICYNFFKKKTILFLMPSRGVIALNPVVNRVKIPPKHHRTKKFFLQKLLIRVILVFLAGSVCLIQSGGADRILLPAIINTILYY